MLLITFVEALAHNIKRTSQVGQLPYLILGLYESRCTQSPRTLQAGHSKEAFFLYRVISDVTKTLSNVESNFVNEKYSKLATQFTKKVSTATSTVRKELAVNFPSSVTVYNLAQKTSGIMASQPGSSREQFLRTERFNAFVLFIVRFVTHEKGRKMLVSLATLLNIPRYAV